ncbi:MAG: 2-phospho-L-lactate guanylyltransferase [Anaerolineaceae bacterium]|jgi:2-phospho-L-lactate guanylyltransferase
MPIWAIVPVKPFLKGKSRLHQMLETEEVVELNRGLFLHTIQLLQNTPEIDEILVVSRSESVIRLAAGLNTRTLREKRPYSLNSAVNQAQTVLQNVTDVKILIVPTDLPWMEQRDLAKFLSMIGNSGRQVGMVSDQHKQGTNLLFISPVNQMCSLFGTSSYLNHCQAALESGADLLIYELENIQRDLDNPAELVAFLLEKPEIISNSHKKERSIIHV